MGRGPKPTKGRAKAAGPRKSAGHQATTVPDLEKRLAEALAREAAALKREAETREQQTATAEILRVISSSLTDLQPMLDAVAKSAAMLCASYDASILRLDDEILRLVAHHGPVPVPTGFVMPAIRGMVGGRAVLDRQPIHVTDLQMQAEEFPEGSAIAREHGFHTLLSVPLLRDGAAIGVIALRRIEVQPFTETQIELLQTFADQAVIAIENVRLFKELQEKNRALTDAHAQISEALDQQTATAEILRVISSSPTDLQPVFDALLRSAQRLLGARTTSVFLRLGDEIHLAAFTSAGEAGDAAYAALFPMSLDHYRDRFPFSMLDWIIGSVTHVPDVELDTRSPEISRRLARARGFRSVLQVPMRREGQVIGVLGITHSEAGAFAEHEIALAQTFADQAVIAIENVRLFTELQEKNHALTQAHAQVTEALDQQTATSEILRVISSSPTDVQPVFDTIVKSAVKLCNGVFGGLYRFDGELIHSASTHNYRSEALKTVRSIFPARPSRALLAGRTILERAVIQVPDLELDRESELQELGRAIGARSSVGIPMLRGGISIGAVVVSRAQPGSFSDSDVALLKTFATRP